MVFFLYDFVLLRFYQIFSGFEEKFPSSRVSFQPEGLFSSVFWSHRSKFRHFLSTALEQRNEK